MSECDNCGQVHDPALECPDDTPVTLDTTSDADGKLDQMVEQASVPNLATLIQRGKDAGLIKPVVGYVST